MKFLFGMTMYDIREKGVGLQDFGPGMAGGRWNFNVFRKSNPGGIGISTVPGGNVPKTLEFQCSPGR